MRIVKIVLSRSFARKSILAILAGIFIFSSYKVIDYIYIIHQTKQTYNEYRDMYTQASSTVSSIDLSPAFIWLANEPAVSTPPPQSQRTLVIQKKFSQLLEQNEDIVGWLTIDNTHIDYPVLQAEDNDYYLHLNVDEKWSFAGSIFMDFRNNVKEDDQNTIIYGHNMNDDSMFSDLKKYEDEEYFRAAPTIHFNSIYEDQAWEIFSVYRTTTDNPYLKTSFASETDFAAYIADAKARSLYEIDVEVAPSEWILTLSTCTNDDDEERFVVHAKLITVHN